MAPLYSSVPVSRDSVTVTQCAWKPKQPNGIQPFFFLLYFIHTCAFPTVTCANVFRGKELSMRFSGERRECGNEKCLDYGGKRICWVSPSSARFHLTDGCRNKVWLSDLGKTQTHTHRTWSFQDVRKKHNSWQSDAANCSFPALATVWLWHRNHKDKPWPYGTYLMQVLPSTHTITKDLR